MKKVFASIVLSLFIIAIAVPSMAYTDDKPKKAEKEQCCEKKACDKTSKPACDKSPESKKCNTEK